MNCTGAQTRSHNTAALFEQMDKDSPLARKNVLQTLINPKGISTNRGTASHRRSACTSGIVRVT